MSYIKQVFNVGHRCPTINTFLRQIWGPYCHKPIFGPDDQNFGKNRVSYGQKWGHIPRRKWAVPRVITRQLVATSAQALARASQVAIIPPTLAVRPLVATSAKALARASQVAIIPPTLIVRQLVATSAQALARASRVAIITPTLFGRGPSAKLVRARRVAIIPPPLQGRVAIISPKGLMRSPWHIRRYQGKMAAGT